MSDPRISRRPPHQRADAPRRVRERHRPVHGRSRSLMQEIIRHRQVLLAACAGVGLSIAAIPPFVLSVFAGPMARDFGWSLQQFQTVTLAVPLGVLIAAPLGGWLLDRYGSRRVALTGLAAFAASVAGLALSTANPWTFYMAMFVLSIAAAGVLPTTWTRIINGTFDRQRGLALGITLSGSGVFATFGPALAQWVIDAAGWRVAWIVLAALPLCIALPLVAAFIKPEGAAASPAGAPSVAPRAPSHQSGEQSQGGLALGAALRSRRFWIMVASFGAVSFCLGGFNANLVPILISEGLTSAEAARLAGTLGVSLITGRLIAGVMIDRFWPPGVAAIAFSLPLLGAMVLMGDSLTPTMLVLCVALMGFAAGAEYDVLAFMTSRYFGLTHYGKIYAVMLLPISIATSAGAVAFGRIRDGSSSFDAAWPVVLVVCGAGALLQLALGREQSQPSAR
ncbi:MAG: MFS transporter [Sinobacteraceae bacterium]|nr:MFS transporter [Nevskiaceae bacterium]